MATLSRYPLLRSLLEDLTRLSRDGETSAGRAADKGEQVTCVSVPWVPPGRFWVTHRHAELVRLLIEAYTESRSPEVSQGSLLAAIKSKENRLEGELRGSPLWLSVIIPGRRPGHYRIAPVPEPTPAPEG